MNFCGSSNLLRSFTLFCLFLIHDFTTTVQLSRWSTLIFPQSLSPVVFMRYYLWVRRWCKGNYPLFTGDSVRKKKEHKENWIERREKSKQKPVRRANQKQSYVKHSLIQGIQLRVVCMSCLINQSSHKWRGSERIEERDGHHVNLS